MGMAALLASYCLAAKPTAAAATTTAKVKFTHLDAQARGAFTNIYVNSTWAASNQGRGSGPGSSVHFTSALRKQLAAFVRDEGISSMVDTPSGAMAWTDQFLKTGVPPSFRYFGGDIVAHVVAANTRRWAGDPNKKFGVVDISQTPVEPGYDLILCRDALQHLPYRMVFDALSNFAQSDAKFLLVGSYPNGEVDPACRDYRCGGKNCDLGVPGDHAFLVDLAKPPFGLKPDRIIKEGAGRPHCATDKYLYVFRISYLRTVDFRALKAAALA